MRYASVVLISALVTAVALPAAAGDMTLSRSTGTLYRLSDSDDGLVVNARYADGVMTTSAIPQTTASVMSSLNVAVDPASGGVYALWQEDDSEFHSRIRFAYLLDGTWSGPFTLAGDDGTDARNPQMMFDHVVTDVEVPAAEEGGDPTIETVATSFVHMVWWSHLGEGDSGAAFYVGLPLADDGRPDFSHFAPAPLTDLLPYGIGCHGLDGDAHNLTFPKLFLDPQSGNPHVFATDFSQCLFQILRIMYDVVEEDDPATGLKRRRHIADWRSEEMIGVNPSLPLSTATAEVGHNLSIVLYWDADQAVDYMQMSEDETSEIRSLPLGADLSHEQAVDLIRTLAR